jgi:hypothetical protein
VRKPEKIFESAEHGYNLQTMYQQAKDFLIEKSDAVGEDVQSYHYCLFLIKTTKNQIFGAFVSAYPTYNPRVQFKGS